MRVIRIVRDGLICLGPITVLTYAGVTASPTSAATSTVSANSNSSATWSSPAFPETMKPVYGMQSGLTLRFEWAAVNLALQPPYDTIQLRAILRTAAGTVVHDTSTVHYATSDSAISVSATGVVIAHSSTTPNLVWGHTPTGSAVAHVIASVTQGGQTLTDTAFVQVTPRPFSAPLATLSIQPQPGGLESAHSHVKSYVFDMGFDRFPVFATTATGTPANDTVCNKNSCGLLVHFTSSDPTIAKIDDVTGEFDFLRPGRVTFTVSTIAYGVRKRDSLSFSIGGNQRTTGDLHFDKTWDGLVLDFSPRNGRWGPPYGVGLRVFFGNFAGEQVEVTLPQPAHGLHFETGDGLHSGVPLPNLVDTLPNDRGIIIRFDSAGTYVLRYRSLTTGALLSDTLTVVPDP